MGKESGERRSKQEAGGRVCLIQYVEDVGYRLQPLVSAFFPYRGIDLSGPQCQVSGTRPIHHGTVRVPGTNGPDIASRAIPVTVPGTCNGTVGP